MSNVNSADFRDKYLGRIWTDSFRNSIEMLPTLSSIQRAIFGFHKTRNTSRKLRPKYGRPTRRAFKVLLTAHPSMQTLNGWKRMYHPAQNPAIGKAMKMSSISHRMENRILTTAFESAISAAEIKGNKCTNKLIPSFIHPVVFIQLPDAVGCQSFSTGVRFLQFSSCVKTLVCIYVNNSPQCSLDSNCFTFSAIRPFLYSLKSDRLTHVGALNPLTLFDVTTQNSKNKSPNSLNYFTQDLLLPLIGQIWIFANKSIFSLKRAKIEFRKNSNGHRLAPCNRTFH